MNPEIKINPGEAEIEAEILLAHLLGVDRAALLAHPERPIDFWVRRTLARLLKKRARGVPLAYLTGHKEFFGLDFAVNRHTLVPRPDTELMVEAVVERIKRPSGPSRGQELGNKLLIDVGTGSGCIPISIMKTLKLKNIKTLKQVIATDISRGALRVARQNARCNQVAITFLQGNLLTPINNETISPFNNVIITANLPYLTAAQFAAETSIQHEPRTALVADNDGLALYEKLLQQIKTWPQLPHTLTLFFEIDPSQSTRITTLIHTFFPTAQTEIKKDLAEHDRLVIAEIY